MSHPPVDVLPVEDPEAWTESSLRAWEAEINEHGWGRVPRFSLLMRFPNGDGLGLAEMDIEERLMRHPDMLFGLLAQKPLSYLHQFFGAPHWSGMTPVAGVLCDEGRGVVIPQELNLAIFPPGERLDMPRWMVVRRVMMVAPREEHDATLLRQKGQLAPQLRQGVPAESRDGGTPLRELIRQVVRKLVPPELR